MEAMRYSFNWATKKNPFQLILADLLVVKVIRKIWLSYLKGETITFLDLVIVEEWRSLEANHIGPLILTMSLVLVSSKNECQARRG